MLGGKNNCPNPEQWQWHWFLRTSERYLFSCEVGLTFLSDSYPLGKLMRIYVLRSFLDPQNVFEDSVDICFANENFLFCRSSLLTSMLSAPWPLSVSSPTSSLKYLPCIMTVRSAPSFIVLRHWLSCNTTTLVSWRAYFACKSTFWFRHCWLLWSLI